MEEFKILYIEDDEDTKEEISLFLKPKCDSLYVASDGEEGLELFKKHSFDLIISDVSMPKLNGIKMAQAVREIDSSVPIIFISAYSEVEYLKASLDMRITAYITKPIDLKLLSTKIDEIAIPKRAFMAICYVDQSANIVDMEGICNIFSDRKSLLNTSFASLVKDKKKFYELFANLKSSESFYREKIVIKNQENTHIEFLCDGVKVNENLYKLSLTSMDYFIHSYEKISYVLEKERTLRKIAESKNNIHFLSIKSKTIDDFLTLVCKSCVKKLGFTTAMIYQKSENKDDEYVLSTFYASEHIDKHKMTFKFFLDDENLKSTKCILNNSVETVDEPNFENCTFFDKGYELKSIQNIILVPIYIDKHKKADGILVVLNPNPLTFDQEDLPFVNDIGVTIALGVERLVHKQRLIETLDKVTIESRIDALTNIYNRLMFKEMLEKNINQSQRQKTQLSLIYMDIDNFKQINDTFGHDSGDKVLKNFAQIISKSIRNIDIFARIGGEEFCILMPTTSLDEAVGVAKKLVLLIENSPLHERKITISAGVVLYKMKESMSEFLKRGDKKLYEAKNGGKNQVCF